MAQQSRTHAETLPYWSDSASVPTFPKIDRDTDADVVVIGAGITGLTTAYLLLTAGKSVVVLDRARCAQIDTGHTSAHLTMVTDSRLTDLVSRLGRPHAQAVWDAGLAAIDLIYTTIGRESIDADFAWVDGYLHAPNGQASDSDVKAFREEATLAAELGFDTAFVNAVPFIGGAGVQFGGQARFHPRKYIAGLAKAIRDKGGAIHEHSEAEEFLEDPLRVKANGVTVRCRDIVIATHNPLVGITGFTSATLFQTKLALYSSYVVAGRVPHDSVPDALFWDTDTAYRYLRLEPQRDGDLIILGGEDHKTGQVTDTNACYETLEKSLRTQVLSIELSHRWSGQVIETPDGLPYIGPMTDHQYAATGYAGNGLTFGTVGAMIMSDQILGRKNPWADLFDPGRKALTRGLWDYLKQNADYPYYMMRDRIAGPDAKSLRAVPRGAGRIIERNGAKVAAYRDTDGTTILRSAVCTHMGCLVAWNDAEHTWDCPCHGSRFTPKGDVISGPAESPLSEPNG